MIPTVVLVTLIAAATAAPRSWSYGRAVGGENPNYYSDYSHQLSLRLNGKHICGAAIISPSWAITTGHCTFGHPANTLSVRAGSLLLNSGGEVIQVKTVYHHPNFNVDSNDYDVSLLELAADIPSGGRTSVVKLADANATLIPGTVAVTSGWGVTEEQGFEYSERLQGVVVPLISNENCRHFYGEYTVTDRMLCAGYAEGQKDTCHGDAGGPLLVDEKLVGLDSWGKGCARPKFPGVYTNLVPLREFVASVTGI